MSNQNYDFNNYQTDALQKPRDKAWDNWAKFEKVGDLVQGFIRDVFFRESEGDFSEQRGITLETVTGEFINVGIKHIDFVLAKTDNLRLNDPMTMVFEKEIPSTTKGYSAIKQFGFYGKNLPENANEKTVKELEALDRGIALEAKAKADADFEGTAVAGVETTATPASVGATTQNNPTDLPFESTPAPMPATIAPAAAPVAPAAPVVATTAETATAPTV
jgi:hypothetical protein